MSKFLLNLVILLPALSLAKPCPAELDELVGSDQRLEIRRERSAGVVETVGVSRVTPENIDSIFSHAYNRGRGVSGRAKALAYVDSQGETRVVFWSTGQQSHATEIHHRDVLAQLLRRDATQMRNMANEMPEARIEEALVLLDNANLYEQWATGISSVRLQQSFPPELLIRVQGFRLTAGPVSADRVDLTIRDFQVDSSITATQKRTGAFLDGERQTRAILAVHEAIDPRVRGGARFGRVKINGFSQLPESLQDSIRIRLGKNGLYPVDLNPKDRIQGY